MQRSFQVTPLDGLGTSECPVYCCNVLGMPVRPGSCGRAGPGSVIELMDDQLQPIPAEGEGLLCVRRDIHPGIMKHYWNKPQQTDDVFRGPWYVTGDVLRRDEAGYFWFQGRSDDLIKTSGYLVSPFEVESCLCRHPVVQEAAAIAVRDDLRGHVIKGLVVVRGGSSPSIAVRENPRFLPLADGPLQMAASDRSRRFAPQNRLRKDQTRRVAGQRGQQVVMCVAAGEASRVSMSGVANGTDCECE